MISLQAFGGLELRGDDGRELHSVLAQPKRQALLVYLAVANPRGFHRRETLLAMFWPELDDAHARAALSRAVHYLRLSLGSDVVLSRGHDEVGLDWSRFWCDVAGFETALDRGETAEAMAMYRGDLLPGFYVDDAAEFEQWLNAEQTRLRARAVQATRSLSEQQEALGHGANAVEWARRAVALAPFDEPAVRRLMSLLDVIGDRAGALRVYEELAARLLQELEALPSGESVLLINSIRARVDQPVAPIAVATSKLLSTTSSIDSRPIDATKLDPAQWRRFAPWAAVVLLIASAAFIAVGHRMRAGIAAESSATVAVVPFVVQGDSSANYLSAGMVSLLAEQFNQSTLLRALDTRAILHATQRHSATLDPGEARTLLAKLRPRFVVTGVVSATKDSITITATLFDSIDTQVRPARAAVSGPAAEVSRLIRTVATHLMLTQPTGQTRLTPEPFTGLTTSLEALKYYVAGEQAYAAGHFIEAVHAYRAAVTEDTTFALAFLWLSRSANWVGDQATMAWASDRALEFVDKLALLNQFRVRGWIAYQRGQAEQSERLYQIVLANDFAAADAWLTLGELRYHWGPLLGWTLPQARDAFEHAVAISAPDIGSIIHLARMAAVDDRVASLDSLIRRAEVGRIDEIQALELEGLQAFVTGNRRAQTTILAALGNLNDDAAFSVVISIAASTGQYEDAGQLATILMGPRRSPQIRAVGAMLSAQLAMAHGQWLNASTQLKNTQALTPARALEYRAALATLPFQTAPANELRMLRDAIAVLPQALTVGPWFGHYAANAIYDPRRLYLLGMLDLRLGHTAGVTATIRQLEAAVSDPVNRGYRRDVANLLRAELLRERGKPVESLAALGPPHVLPDSVLPGTLAYPSAHERFLRGELLRQLRKYSEALRWYETFPDPAAYDLMYLAPVHLAKSDIYRRLGDHAAARAAQQRADALRTQTSAMR
ncbi:MAG TPA: BTAD domain-containing putative transcriptional regulator [Longimicrobiales bacterium]|nr:BTAD domain-containing putative transcriptional regulator [Longimicrobiales bacterium]